MVVQSEIDFRAVDLGTILDEVGDDFRLPLRFIDASTNTGLDLSGISFVAALGESDTLTVDATDAANGNIVLTATATQTTALGAADHDITLYSTDPEVTSYAKATLRLEAITR